MSAGRFDVGATRFMGVRASRAPLVVGGAAAIALSFMTAAKADPGNLVQNGDFSETTAYTANGTGTEISNSNLTDWGVSACLAHCSTSAPNNLFMFLAPTNIATNGVYDANEGGGINFWSTPGAAPGGGNAITSDANTESGLLYQTISGLKSGDTYTLSFYQATIQATNKQGPFTGQWEVGFGDSVAQYSTAMSNPGETNTPWVQDTMTFTADAASEALGFFATADSGDEPPFLLLSDVSLTDSTPVPEPATFGLLMAGAAGMLVVRRRRRNAA